MILMYDTAARCSELLDMKVCDLRLDAKHPIAYLHGKGRKIRTVPLLSKTVQHCKQYSCIVISFFWVCTYASSSG